MYNAATTAFLRWSQSIEDTDDDTAAALRCAGPHAEPGCGRRHAARAQAQPADYPNRPVSFIVPFAPGGVTSLFARILGQKLEQRFGKPFVVENRPGAGGVTAAAAVANATPDGYTIMMASSTVLAINVTMRKSLPTSAQALTPIALLARVPFVPWSTRAADPVGGRPGQARQGEARPTRLRHAWARHVHHLNAEMFKGIFGLDLIHVPYKGSAPALNDLVGGHIQMMFCDVPPAMSLIQAGKLRALGVTTAQRVPAVAELPPLAEVGIPGYDIASWHTVTTTGTCRRRSSTSSPPNIRDIMSDPR